MTTRGHRNEQFLCLQPSGLRVVYPDAKLLAKLPSSTRAAMRGRVAWISTAYSRYALHRVRAGTKLATARRRLHLGAPFRVGANRWYFARSGRVLAVLKVGSGKVREFGIASAILARSRSYEAAFLHSFG